MAEVIDEAVAAEAYNAAALEAWGAYARLNEITARRRSSDVSEESKTTKEETKIETTEETTEPAEPQTVADVDADVEIKKEDSGE